MYRNQIIAVVRDICQQSKERFNVTPVSKIELKGLELKSNSAIFTMEYSYIDPIGAIDSAVFKLEISVWGKIVLLQKNTVSVKVIGQFIDNFKAVYMNWYLEEQDANRSIKKLVKDVYLKIRHQNA